MRLAHAFRTVALSVAAATVLPGQTITNLAAQPTSVPAGIGTPVTVTCRITDTTVLADNVLLQRLDTTGNVLGVLGTMRDDGTQGDATAGDRTFTLRPNVYETTPGILRLRVSAALQGSARRILSSVLDLQVTGAATSVRILSPAADSYLSLSPVQVNGTIGDASLNVSVNGIPASKSGTNFSASVPLIEGTNTLTAVATGTGGSSATSTVQVVLDTTPPRVTITSPADGLTTTATSLNVSGIVNDIVVGTVNPLQATVTVNGIAALVSNRTFAGNNLPLAIGNNNIRAEGRDRAGNTYAHTISVLRQAPPPGTATLAIASGNNQTGVIGAALPQPLIVQLTNAQNQPAATIPVTFRVAEGNGLVNSLPAVIVNTNALGRAQVNFTLGTHSGAGNSRVEAFATGFQGNALFSASATNGTPAKIVVDSGLNQYGAIGQPLPFPFIAVVTDAGNNRLGNVPVTFSVRAGGGRIGSATTFSTMSDSDGRVSATLTLGLEEGVSNNVVQASFTGYAGAPAVFSASALSPGPTAQTAISGVVQDNSNQPIPGVTIRLFRLAQPSNNVQPTQIAPPVTTDAQGAFRITNAPVGVMKLMADGSTAQPTGAWPTLEYDIVTVAGRDNTVGTPIYLPRLDLVNRLCVTATTGGTLTLPQVPGFSLTVAPGSATFPGGARTGCISVTPVNPDKVPMVPGFGQQPRFVVTIQPVGTTFNPPAQIQIPNVDGLAPRAKTEMYSYDHDLAAFVAIGTGTVSADASVIASDPGVGVIKAGWHCGGDPSANGTVADCPKCKWCQNNACVTDPAQANTSCNSSGGCCRNGNCEPPGGVANSVAAFTYPETITAATSGDYGLTSPKPVQFDLAASYDGAGNKWKGRLSKADKPYDIFYRIFGHQSEPNVAGITTRAQACKMRGDLATLGLNPNAAGTTTYMVLAVERHERVHVQTLKNSWNPVFAALKTSIEALEVPFSCTVTAAQAATQLKALPGYQTAIDTASNTAIATWNTEQAVDHNAGGRAEQAEHVVVDPIVAQIDALIVKQGWAACP